MTYLSSNQLKQYEDEGFVSPINIFSKDKAKEIRNEIEFIEKEMPGELDKSGRADVAVQTFFGAKEHEEKTGGAFEVTDPKLMPKETVNVVGIGFRKSDEEFRQAFNAALAKVMANPDKMLERAGKYGYDKAQLPPADMTTEWACSTK